MVRHGGSPAPARSRLPRGRRSTSQERFGSILCSQPPLRRGCRAGTSPSSPAHARLGTHPVGQTLVITLGLGWVQQWGGPKQEVRAGDVVWFPPGIKHWHGASATTAMTHIAIQETVDSKNVDWLEQVSDEQYRGE